MIVRIRCLTSKLLATKSLARASSRSSLADGLESRKSSTGSTMPLPFRWNQMRLTTDLAKNGLLGDVNHVGQHFAGDPGPAGSSAIAPPRNFGSITLPDARLGHLAVRGWNTRSRPLPSCGVLPWIARILLRLHAGEPRGHAVVIVLRPALERVVVALGALHADAEEELGRRFRKRGRLLGNPIVSSREDSRRCCRWRSAYPRIIASNGVFWLTFSRSHN